MSERVFVSYARNDLRGGELQQFFDKLEDDLKVGLGRKDDVLFRDSEDIELGQEWTKAIEEQLKNSVAAIVVYSPSYLASPSCGKEYGVLIERLKAANRPVNGVGGVFPLIWYNDGGVVPEAVSKYQYDHDSLPPTYKANGLRQLFRLNRYQDDAVLAVTAVSSALLPAVRNPLPPLPRLEPWKTQQNIFKAPAPGQPPPALSSTGPNLVRVVVVAGSRTEIQTVRTIISSYDAQGRLWRPYLSDSQRPIAAEAQRIAGEKDLICEFLAVDDDLCDRIRESADRNEIVIVLADPWTLSLPDYAKRLRPYDQLYLLNSAMLVVWNGKDEETNRRMADLESGLSDVFLNKFQHPPPGHLFKEITSHSDLLKHLSLALTEAQLRIIGLTTRHGRADHAGLRQDAASAGIDVATRATIPVPVAGQQ